MLAYLLLNIINTNHIHRISSTGRYKSKQPQEGSTYRESYWANNQHHSLSLLDVDAMKTLPQADRQKGRQAGGQAGRRTGGQAGWGDVDGNKTRLNRYYF